MIVTLSMCGMGSDWPVMRNNVILYPIRSVIKLRRVRDSLPPVHFEDETEKKQKEERFEIISVKCAPDQKIGLADEIQSINLCQRLVLLN